MIQHGPILWARILEPVINALGSGIIAGGAVRDYLLGEPPKDIDIFVNVDDVGALKAAAAKLPETFHVSLMHELTEYETAPDWQSEVFGVLDGYWAETGAELFDEVRVQIIARPMPVFTGQELVKRFDLGITRSWFDGAIHDTPEAERDRAEKTLTLMRWETEAHVAATQRRVERMESRFGFRFVDPRPETSAAA